MNAFCILFTDNYDNSESKMNELSNMRSLASIPFGGRYRLIDFMLSSLVGSQVYDVGIITKSKYGSLMDHVGWGKDWDLNRKNGGLRYLTPFATDSVSYSDNQFDILKSVRGYIDDKLQEYCILADSNIVMNLDFKNLLDAHINSCADITVLCRSASAKAGDLELSLDEKDKVTDALIHTAPNDHDSLVALNVYVLKKSLLRELIDWGVTYGWKSFGKDVISKKFKELNIFGYRHQGYCELIDSLEVYLRANLNMLSSDTRKEIFGGKNPILTRTKDSVPTKYGDHADVKNSYIADGCVINGEVKNSIIFRNVKIEKGVKVENSVIMQNSIVEEHSSLNCVIVDKNARITEHKRLSGCEILPFVINKGKTV